MLYNVYLHGLPKRIKSRRWQGQRRCCQEAPKHGLLYAQKRPCVREFPNFALSLEIMGGGEFYRRNNLVVRTITVMRCEFQKALPKIQQFQTSSKPRRTPQSNTFKLTYPNTKMPELLRFALSAFCT